MECRPPSTAFAREPLCIIQKLCGVVGYVQCGVAYFVGWLVCATQDQPLPRPVFCIHVRLMPEVVVHGSCVSRGNSVVKICFRHVH